MAQGSLHLDLTKMTGLKVDTKAMTGKALRLCSFEFEFELLCGGGACMNAWRNNQLRAQPSGEMHENKFK